MNTPITSVDPIASATKALADVINLQQTSMCMPDTLSRVSGTLQSALGRVTGVLHTIELLEREPLVVPAGMCSEVDNWDNEPMPKDTEAVRCRALLLEVIRRAAHDWVLYRQHTRLPLKQIAQAAHVWLFEEGPGYPGWEAREKTPYHMTAFVNICAELDIEPDAVRQRVLRMRVSEIIGAGRPVERRYKDKSKEDVGMVQHSAHVAVDLSTLGDDPEASAHANYFAVPQTYTE